MTTTARSLWLWSATSPALLARDLRRVALERGVRIIEHTPMTAFDRSARPASAPLDALTQIARSSQQMTAHAGRVLMRELADALGRASSSTG